MDSKVNIFGQDMDNIGSGFVLHYQPMTLRSIKCRMLKAIKTVWQLMQGLVGIT